MTEYIPTIYSDPSYYNLEIVRELSDGGRNEWDVFIVYRDLNTNTILWYYDSGCSCWCPTDGMEVDDLEHGMYDELERDLNNWIDSQPIAKKEPARTLGLRYKNQLEVEKVKLLSNVARYFD